MNNFEAILLISPDLATTKLKDTEKNFEKLIENKGGSIIAKEDWGLKDLSYKINNFKKAFYSYYQVTFEGSKIQEMKKSLTQNEQVIRHLFVKVDKHDELPTKLLKNKE